MNERGPRPSYLACLAVLLSLASPTWSQARSQITQNTRIDRWLSPGVQIAVERLTGVGDDYETSFSGWVGSLRFSQEDSRIYVSAISATFGVVNEVYAVTSTENDGTSIEFEATDLTPPLTGTFHYRGKIWIDGGSIRFEMIRTDSPRRWVNLGPYGRRFLQENGLDQLRLGAF